MSSKSTETEDFIKASPLRSAQETHTKENTNQKIYTDWYSQLRHKITTIQKLSKFINLSTEEQRGIIHSKFPFAVNTYLLEHMDVNSEHCPIRKQFIPTIGEIKKLPEELLEEVRTADVPSSTSYGLKPGRSILRHYLDTVIILVTNNCASYCRYCAVRNFVGQHEWNITHGEFGLVLKYLKEHNEVRQVVLSGGDPLVLSDEKLEFLLSHINKIKNIDLVRIETRIPVILPQRITPKLCEVLSKYQPVFIDVTINHTKEMTQAATYACNLLLSYGIPLVSTTILLKNINDKVQILADLFYSLVKSRIKPYRLIQPEIVEGTSHFRPTIVSGLRLIRQLRSCITSFAIPEYIVNTREGTEIIVAPESVVSRTKNSVMLKDIFGHVHIYPETK
ncbi:MAG: KamA family radical SAM protein [Endomicrobia bacterium]|nr:KamA family radical SAM protein [Endomicrobiia bacterium]